MIRVQLYSAEPATNVIGNFSLLANFYFDVHINTI